VPIIVVDGSQNPLPRDTLKSFSFVTYLHMPNTSVGKRLFEGAKTSTTRYTHTISDDELLNPEALSELKSFLDSNFDFVAACGHVVAWRSFRGFLFVKPFYLGFSKVKVDQESPIERVRNHMSNYQPCSIYSLVRTDVLVTSLQAVSIVDYPEYPEFCELVIEIGNAAQGKLAVIPVVSWFRNFNVPKLWKPSNLIRSWKDLKSTPSFQFHSNQVNELFMTHLNDVPPSQPSEIIQVGLDSYFFGRDASKKQKQFSYFLRRIPHLLRPFVPNLLDFLTMYLLRRLISHYRNTNQEWYSEREFVNRFAGSGYDFPVSKWRDLFSDFR
jgi:glycosyltransferase domain-containing protein